MRFYHEILIYLKMGEVNSNNTRNYIFYLPLVSQNVEEFEARRTDMDTISDGIRDLPSIQVNEKLGINKVGVICRMAEKDFAKIKGFVCSISFKPPLIKILFRRKRLIP